MSRESYISQADSDIVTEHSDSVAYLFKDDPKTCEHARHDQYLAAKDRLESLIIGLRDRIKELENTTRKAS